MPIITQCPSCGKKLRAPDQQAGKQAKCPQCKKPFVIKPIAVGAATGGGSSAAGGSSTAAVSSVVAGSSASGPQTRPGPQPRAGGQPASQPAEPQHPNQWFVQTGEGQEYGPVTRQELDQWLTEDRIDAECQVLQEGWDQWKWAEDVFPELTGGGPADDNPFAALGDTSSVLGRSGSVVTTGAAASSGSIAGSGSFPSAAADTNPYASPQQTVVAGGGAGGGAITENIVLAMQGTRPWVLLFSILTFIGAGVATIGAILGLISMGQSLGGGLMVFLMFALNAGISGYVGYLLLSYSKSAGHFAISHNVADLEKALTAQKNFWKTVGILTLVSIGVNFVVLLSIILFFGTMFGAAVGGVPG